MIMRDYVGEERERLRDENARFAEQINTLRAELHKFRWWVEWVGDNASVQNAPDDLLCHWEKVRVERIRAAEEARRRAEAEKADRIKQLKTELAEMEKRRKVVEKELGELCPA